MATSVILMTLLSQSKQFLQDGKWYVFEMTLEIVFWKCLNITNDTLNKPDGDQALTAEHKSFQI